VIDVGFDEFVLARPLKTEHDASHRSIDIPPAPAALNHRLSDGLQLERPEVVGVRRAKKLAQDSESLTDVVDFVGW